MTTTTTKRPTKPADLREARLELIPGGTYLPASDDLTAVVLATRNERLCAYGFRGRSMKAAFRYWFPSEEARNKHVTDWLTYENEGIAERKAWQASRRARHTLAVGDVVYTSWGYEQTNVEFYEVIAVRGAAVDIRELKQDRTYAEMGMQGGCTPIKGDYKGEPIKGKRPDGRNTIRINSHITASPWDGRPMHWSSYA